MSISWGWRAAVRAMASEGVKPEQAHVLATEVHEAAKAARFEASREVMRSGGDRQYCRGTSVAGTSVAALPWQHFRGTCPRQPRRR